MPTTLASLVIFLVLLMPGFAYRLLRERSASHRSFSPFRETISLAFTSVLADAAALAVFAALRALFPKATPDVGRLVRDPGGYFGAHYATLFAWGAGLLALATLLAALAAAEWPRRLYLSRFRPDWKSTTSQSITYLSNWWALFTRNPGTRKYVGCVLDDGSYVAGWLKWFSNSADDGPDRELSLTGPIYYRKPNAAEAVELRDVHAVAVSARKIVLLTVSYLRGDDASPAAELRDRSDARDG
ncbi:DUF6338 family protein [Saccharothrix coeruleofusca]|uniref:Uncharacterized protein n=1 Tax=Saccharothrix coeruleofusca TaxID=33919 RepID=A0A918ASH6_9PSEU|nr:DUF6338 family protein [Saccharothrix coeruleofusca]MBP2335349.1 hypothetical protein [Saccharothrix coeruleofusca]GGP77280.1 hypothetical protein GCM10010185_58670 [Saccharothrix coeruleofusca]